MTIQTVDTAVSDSMTPGEIAYFKSGGADMAALEQELAGTQPAESPQQPAADGREPAKSEAAPDDVDTSITDGDDIVIGEDGRARNKSGQFVKHVPLAALHKERDRRRAIDSELAATREKVARADERLNILNEFMGIKKAAEAPAKNDADEEVIDPEKDIFGAHKQAMRMISKLQAELSEQRKTTETREANRTVVDVYRADVERFSKDTPDFADAYKHLVDGRHRELEAMGVADKMARDQTIAKEASAIIAQAVNARQSPAQLLYNVATARGYAKPAAVPAAETQKTAQPSPAEKIDAISRGQRIAGTSLSSAGGTGSDGLTVSALADMTDEQFSAWKSSAGKAAYRKLMGG